MKHTLNKRHHGVIGFTLTELLVVIAILGVLAMLVISGLNGFIEKGKAVACLGNIKTLMVTYRTWLVDHGGRAPGEGPSFNYTQDFIPNYLPAELRCPSVPDQQAQKNILGFRYAYNNYIRQLFPTLSDFPVPSSRVVLVAEMYYFREGFWSASHFNTTINGSPKLTPPLKPQHHMGGLHFGFVDGHAELVKPTDGDWWKPPTYGGLYYQGTHFIDMKNGRIP